MSEMFEASTSSCASTPTSRPSSPTPPYTPMPDWRATWAAATPSWLRSSRPAAAWQATETISRPPGSSAREDASFRDELPRLQPRATPRRATCASRCSPTDPNDGKDVILEVKAGEGGEESALFAGDLLRMYLRYAERQGWKTEILDATDSDLGGYKDVTARGQGAGPADRAVERG